MHGGREIIYCSSLFCRCKNLDLTLTALLFNTRERKLVLLWDPATSIFSEDPTYNTI